MLLRVLTWLSLLMATRWLGSSDDPDPNVRHLWNTSLSRYVALQALHKAELLDKHEIAEAWSRLAIAAHPDSGRPEPIREAAKGTLLLQQHVERLADGTLEPSSDPLKKVIQEAVQAGETDILGLSERDTEGGRGESLPPRPKLGLCYRSREVRVERFSLGFELDENNVVLEVDARGPAHPAGVKTGQKIENPKYVPGDVDTNVRLRQAGREISYRPSAGSFNTWAWQVRPRCTDQR